ncbi:MAG: DNA mismatch repair endonuclease MutL [Roseibacillus sp.]|nr:DNA mismatch repair endonuclease MutL [Roseibacillus sp.]
MPDVRVMPDALASQVAAGEVVERPASVIKELVENSLDAGSSELRVESQRGGVALIKVTDDGCGMGRDDAVLSLERHATSKLREKEGLNAITTLGFRGEALPSIASVSRFRLITRTKDSVSGTAIMVEGGKLKEVSEAGCPPGTTVEVRDLFYNIPARRKFLRSESTEAAHVDYQVRLHALSSPGTRFIYRKDGRVSFDVPATDDRRVRIADLGGRQNLGNLREVSRLEYPGMAVSGYLGSPDAARKSRRGQYLFLNGRPVEDQVVWRALAEACRGSLPGDHHPAAWLWLEMDPLLVDVNVHPSKREVRFHRPGDLRALLLEAIGGVITGKASGGTSSSSLSGADPSSRKGAIGKKVSEYTYPRGEELGDELGENVDRTHPAGGEIHVREGEPDLAGPRTWKVEVQSELTAEGSSSKEPPFRVMGVLHGSYFILEGSDGLALLEGEAARERILFETFLTMMGKGAAESQGMLVPLLLDLESRDLDVVLRNVDNFRAAGMELEPFGSGTVQLRCIPSALGEEDARALLLDVVDELVHSAEGKSSRELTSEKFAAKLAKVGAKRGRCRENEGKALLKQLFECDQPYITPGGRPIMVEFALSELERKFGK